MNQSSLSRPGIRRAILSSAAFAVIAISALQLRGDEPYARNRDYDLQHSKMSFRFDLEQKKVLGDVTHTVVLLRENTSKIAFDSVGLTIQSVTVNKSPVKFETTAAELLVPISSSSHVGEKFEIEIRYEGKPTKGLYFILPDKDYPNRPKQIWTQGESEDTRYYLPTYDYPNDRLTTETIVTVPGSWITVANGKLIKVAEAENGMKTWTWRESLPSSTYLITEYPGDEDGLISHELAHQWFGDLVTCKDWGNIWLNEGFATFFEMVWFESHYTKDYADYQRWNAAQEWLGQPSLYAKTIVRHD